MKTLNLTFAKIVKEKNTTSNAPRKLNFKEAILKAIDNTNGVLTQAEELYSEAIRIHYIGIPQEEQKEHQKYFVDMLLGGNEPNDLRLAKEFKEAGFEFELIRETEVVEIEGDKYEFKKFTLKRDKKESNFLKLETINEARKNHFKI